jgi:carbon monoxide dehydrogenase subunit G
MDEKFTVPAGIQTVWDFVLDPEKIGPCVPGFVSATKIDDETYDSVVKVKVGIIKLKMFSRTKFVEVDPPRHIKVAGDGHDRLKAGKFHQESVIDLREISENETEIHYRTNVRVVGKLAVFGEKMMRLTAAKMGEQVAKNIAEAIAKL